MFIISSDLSSLITTSHLEFKPSEAGHFKELYFGCKHDVFGHMLYQFLNRTGHRTLPSYKCRRLYMICNESQSVL